MKDRTPPSQRNRKTELFVIKTCVICGDEFRTPKSLAHRYVTCSRECGTKRKQDSFGGRVDLQCELCGKMFTRTASRARYFDPHFCSDACRMVVLNQQERHRTEGLHNVTITERGYRRGWVWRDGKRIQVMEHRWVMEQQLGRRLRPEERVHHINHDKLDNRIENLELYSSQADHMRSEHHEHMVRISKLPRTA